MNNSYVVRQERCPECAKLGKDVSGDNLAIYSDGHQWCFSCGFHFYPSKMFQFQQKQMTEEEIKKTVNLPDDCDIDYPERALNWIRQYELSKVDLLNNNVMWSEGAQRLIFPIYGDGSLIAYQGRYFGNGNSALTKIPKWYGKGDLANTFNILGKGTSLVLVEDIVSAIKVSKCGVQAMPLYGCVVGRQRFKRLLSLVGHETHVRLWLDLDKAKESIIEAKLGRTCGLNCSNIISPLDPKEHSYEQIKKIVDT